LEELVRHLGCLRAKDQAFEREVFAPAAAGWEALVEKEKKV